MKRFLSALLLCVATLSAMAVPVKPGQWTTIRLADGSTVKVEARGDEYSHYYQDAAGQCYTLQSRGVYQPASFDEVKQTGLLRRRMAAEKQSLRAAAQRQRQSRVPVAKATQMTGDPLNLSGNQRGLIILAEFADTKFTMDDPRAFYDKAANTENFSENGFRGSVRDYFKDQSRGQLIVDFDVVGPVQLPKNYAYYGKDYGGEGNDQHITELLDYCLDRCHDSLDVDFSKYDWMKNGEVDQVFVLYAGKGQATSYTNSDLIWPHMSILDQSAYYYGNKNYDFSRTYDGVKIDTYACSNEIDDAGVLMGPGTICHEFSHCLGFPDMYDNYGNYGMGTWDLMCSGSYNGTSTTGNGTSYKPAGYTSYERMVAGWLQPIELADDDVSVTGMMPLSEGGESYIIRNRGNENEYLLLENRARSGWDEALGGQGLLILHVNWVRNAWMNNQVNTSGAYNAGYEYLTIVPADGTKTSNTEAGDPFPTLLVNKFIGTDMKTLKLINQNTDGTNTIGINLMNIGRDSQTHAVKFDYQSPNTANPSNANQPITRNPDWDDDVMFWETFDKCNSFGGNDDGDDSTPEWTNRAGMGDFEPDFIGWKNTNNLMGGGYKCAKFGTGSKNGDATTPVFLLDGTAQLFFRVAGFGTDLPDSPLTISATKGVTLSQSEVTIQPGQWTEHTLTIDGSGEVRVTFTPANKVNQRRIFIDEVKVTLVADGITDVTAATTTQHAAIYTLSGNYVGTSTTQLPKGIYVRAGKKFVVK